MRLWRISNYADLSGRGGFVFSARWHTKGREIIYAAEHSAGALSEFLVHTNLEDIPASFQLITIEIDDGLKIETILPRQLPSGWAENTAITRAIGNKWLIGNSSLLLRVPSVIVPDAYNMLINPNHADASKMRFVKSEHVPLDSRLGRS